MNNNNILIFTNVSLFYVNKEFHSYISFSSDTTDYVIIRKYFNIIKTKNIIDYIQNVFIYIRENLNKA